MPYSICINGWHLQRFFRWVNWPLQKSQQAAKKTPRGNLLCWTVGVKTESAVEPWERLLILSLSVSISLPAQSQSGSGSPQTLPRSVASSLNRLTCPLGASFRLFLFPVPVRQGRLVSDQKAVTCWNLMPPFFWTNVTMSRNNYASCVPRCECAAKKWSILYG